MKKLILAAAALTMTATAGWSQAIRLGTEGAYPPFNFVNDAGEIDGFERELGDTICAKAGLDCTWVKNDWDSIIPNLVSGNYDVIIAGMSITPERDEVIDFTSEYYPPDPSAYVTLDGQDVDVSGGVIAAQVNTIQAAHVAASGATLVEFATPDETIGAVRNGEADAVLADKGFLTPIVSESGGELVFLGDDVMIGGGVGMGVRESDGELKAKLDTAIAALKEDGTINTLIEKWFEDLEGPY